MLYKNLKTFSITRNVWRLFQSRISFLLWLLHAHFFRLSFRNCKSCVTNCHDHTSFNSSLPSSHNMIFIYSKLHLKKHLRTLLLVLISNNYWTRLSKFVICLWRADQLFAEAEARLRQIIDLRDTDKSGYFAITEFNNCFIIRSPSFFFFNEYPREAKWSAIFTQERSQEGEKHGFLYACAEYYLQPNTVGRHCTWADHYL